MTTNGAHNEDLATCESSCITKASHWDVQKILTPSLGPQYGILILNRPITQHPAFLKRVWNEATIRMTVDGGTKRWDKYLNDLPENEAETYKLPELITGDFDSITEEILDKYKQKGCKVVYTPDTSHTDGVKALMELDTHTRRLEIKLEHALTICQSSGRIDQTLGNIHTLFLARNQMLVHPNTKVFLLGDDALSWLLDPGYHVIMVPEESRTHKKTWCSLVPIGEACGSITTTGLKWNLENSNLLKYGVLVSTSNRFDGSEVVTIQCSHTVLWSMRVPSVMNP